VPDHFRDHLNVVLKIGVDTYTAIHPVGHVMQASQQGSLMTDIVGQFDNAGILVPRGLQKAVSVVTAAVVY
jgi:hypothetical protein